MKNEHYVTLRDVNEEPRVIICMLKNDENTLPSFGLAIRSDDDDNDFKRGKRLAKRRAMRIAKYRNQCLINREEAFYNIWNLKFEDFFRFMKLTALNSIPKMDFMYQDVKDGSEINFDNIIKMFEGRK